MGKFSRKRRYRAVSLSLVHPERFIEAFRGKKLVVGVDVGKEEQYCALLSGGEEVEATLKWKQPEQTREFVDFLLGLGAQEVEVALEPSGTYGDALRVALQEAGIGVYRVRPKQVHDAAEVYDGVPSHHDAKSAAIVAKLHVEGRSESWRQESERERELKAAVRLMSYYESQFGRARGQLEALLARHWPELERVLKPTSGTALALLAEYGSPAAVVEDEEGARRLMRKVGGWNLNASKLERVLASARRSTGVVPVEWERRRLMELCEDMRRSRREERRVRREVERLSQSDASCKPVAALVGKLTSVVFVSEVGEAKNYASSAQYLRSFGLNLKEHSSGKKRGRLHISKRGSSVARQYLYLAAWRQVQRCEATRAWYRKKVERDGGARANKNRALVAVMRKLARALWHVGQGREYEPARLYDLSRLGLEEARRLPAHRSEQGVFVQARAG